MLRILIYLLIGLVSFLVFMAVLAPAAPLWNLVSDKVTRQVPDLRVLLVRGTIWDGSAELQYRLFPTSRLDWRTRAGALLGANLELALGLEGEDHQFNGEVTANFSTVEIRQLVGALQAGYINRVSQPQGLTFSGTINVNQFALSFTNPNTETGSLGHFTSVSGNLDWPGGRIVSRTRLDGTRVLLLPPLAGEFRMTGEDLQLDIHHLNSETGANDNVVDIRLKPTGWIVVKVKVRLFDLAKLPWPAGTSLDDTVLEFEEKVL